MARSSRVGAKGWALVSLRYLHHNKENQQQSTNKKKKKKKRKTHKGRQEGGGRGGRDWASRDMLMSLMTLP